MATRSAPSEKTAIENAIAALKEAVKGDDAEDIKAKTNALAQASMKLGEAMYKAQQAGKARRRRRPPTAPSKPDDNVVDAEFAEVDDNKKKARPKAYRPFARKRVRAFRFHQGAE